MTGPLSSFRKDVAEPIMAGLEPHADVFSVQEGQKVSARLRASLGQIMLRRTQADVLSALLPPRTDLVLYVGLTARQQTAYAWAARQCRYAVIRTDKVGDLRQLAQ